MLRHLSIRSARHGTGHDRIPAARALPFAALIVFAACSSDPASNPAGRTDETTLSAVTTEEFEALPVRVGPRRETTGDVPHQQIDATPVPELDAELERRASALPGVEKRESQRSLPGARGLWLSEDLDLDRPDVIAGTREFAHIHPDGSLHIWLPVDRATEVDQTGWGEIHPWVGRDGFWDGVVMVFTPESPEELDVTMHLVVDAYNYITGADIDPTEIT